MTTLLSRFSSKYVVNKDTGCWDWTAYKDKRGYGAIWHHFTMAKSHRVSFELYKKRIPTGLHVLHSCDNPSCVNPDHLHLGTHQDNMDDMHNKGRWQPHRGEAHGCSKLNKFQVRVIKHLLEFDNMTKVDIGKLFSVTDVAIYHISTGKNWSHI